MRQFLGLFESVGFRQIANALTEKPVVAGDRSGDGTELGQKLAAGFANGLGFGGWRPLLVVIVPDAQPSDNLVAFAGAVPQSAGQVTDALVLEAGLKAASAFVERSRVGSLPDSTAA